MLVRSIFCLSILLLNSVFASASSARLIRDNNEALQIRADLILQAKEQITVQYFTMASDQVSTSVLSLLRDAARRGVQVKILVDGFSHQIKPAILAALKKEKNFELKIYNPVDLFTPSKWMNRLHDKSICVDMKICLVGGRNISNKYFIAEERSFNDLDIVFSGASVRTANEYFSGIWKSRYSTLPDLKSYDSAGPYDTCTQKEYDECQREKQSINQEILTANNSLNEKSVNLNYGKNSVIPNSKIDWLEGYEINEPIDFLYDPTDREKSADGIASKLSKIIESETKESLIIISPYVTLSDRVLKLFEQLTAKGVYIRIVTNSLNSSDNVIAQTAYRLNRKSLIDIGVEIWEYRGPDTLHAKAFVIDGHTAVVGSYNFDLISEQKNLELAVRLKNVDLAQKLTKMITDFQENSYLIDPISLAADRDDELNKAKAWKKISVTLLKVIYPIVENMKRDQKR
ncbi:MAG: phosphatidylserine/phosphatidylglycerophosphate/cardiolipin synthase family protein [Bdellovibrio sp.]|nr:phosphatidylserine/phosphatidylglycerophosphate/cardiolipin synthase family protein [Bdellovibrio sp.]